MIFFFAARGYKAVNLRHRSHQAIGRLTVPTSDTEVYASVSSYFGRYAMHTTVGLQGRGCIVVSLDRKSRDTSILSPDATGDPDFNSPCPRFPLVWFLMALEIATTFAGLVDTPSRP